MAGQLIEVKIEARDKYGIAHSSGGAIARADIELVGHIHHSREYYSANHQELVGYPSNIVCEIQDNNNGSYKISAVVNIAGKYNMIINKSEYFCCIDVISGIPYAANFQLLESNVYEVPVGQSKRCDVSMYDSFYNPCPANRWLSNLQGKIETHNSSFTIDQFSRKQSFPTNVFSIIVPAREAGHLQLTILFNDKQLPFCPIAYTVLQQNFKDRVSKLRSCTNFLYWRSRIPTFTVYRDNLLESSMNILMLNPHYFKQQFHVRFGTEPGVDAGGVVKYVNMHSYM